MSDCKFSLMRMWRNQRVVKRESAAIVKKDFFTNLPPEIAIEILSRLPFPTIMKCKCVCKAWRHVLSTREFVDHYYSKSLPGIILSKGAWEMSKRYKIRKFVDSLRHPCNTVYRFSFPRRCWTTLHGSANGLLLFLKRNLLVCNPLTREYIDLPPDPTESSSLYKRYGFGVSKASGEYKVVRISMNSSYGTYKFEVYTLGTGSWRNVAVPAGSALAHRDDPCTFVDGKLYSLAKESCISCFDLETEVLSTVSCPPSSRIYRNRLCALEGRLCLCLNHIDELFIWVMEQVGQWTKEFVIPEAISFRWYKYYPFLGIKVLGQGKILLAGAFDLYYYSRERNYKKLKLINSRWINRRYMYRFSYTPSFLPLTTFSLENVCSF